MSRPFDPKRHCGAKTHPLNGAAPCRHGKGWATGHPGSGHCRSHGGTSPNGRKHAAKEAARAILADLAVPVPGNPLHVLQEVLDSLHGLMLGAQRMVRQLPADADADTAKARIALYVDSLTRTGDLAKKAAEALNDDARIQLDLRTGEIIHRVLTAALDAYESAPDGQRRTVAEEVLIRELVAVGPMGDERN